ncbi:potassium-transporting ATPase subunit C [Aeromicrobium sp. UC242_57]|uniref:potassium-transporting ATPase subunit C n=1 Tax=Aeromicrobium sp. UC242_57 TaxID=3374624 RepID=UPI003791FC2A
MTTTHWPRLRPTSDRPTPDLIASIEERRAAVAEAESVDPADVPADALTASGSGLDPHISVDYAAIQVRRVAAANGLSAAAVERLVEEHREGRSLGFLGVPRRQRPAPQRRGAGCCQRGSGLRSSLPRIREMGTANPRGPVVVENQPSCIPGVAGDLVPDSHHPSLGREPDQARDGPPQGVAARDWRLAS